ncbi:MAG TPA: asparagine--tRNA ligase [Eubacteriales bacterium]|nr:asparagine--tRNA ligase [Clostridia bacterium]HRR89224.1 asparagine--tRNA ligase [Eubacteriales bacterium]HRU84785.1 asparagine--tRNA ligase [Eubacteriales bacterium]
MKHDDICDLLKQGKAAAGKTVTVCGWVRTARDSKSVVFLELNDGTCFNNLQIVADKERPIAEAAAAAGVGTALMVTGNVQESAGTGQSIELMAEEITVLGEAGEDYPLQKKKHSLEFLRTIAHLRARTNTFNAVFRVRNVLSMAIHNFFQERGFLYVHTPIITGSDCEGAGEVFQVTILKNAALQSADYSEDFFGTKAGLTVSGQLEGEAMALAFSKIYTFGPTFRAENSNTPRHAAEFWQIEPEVAFADLYDIIALARDLMKYIIADVLKKCPDEMDFFEKRYEPGLKAKLQNIVDKDFVILEYAKAIEILKNSGEKFEYPVDWGTDLQTEHERYIVDRVYNCPVFIVNYPKKIKSFYMKLNPDGETVASTDLLVPGVGEIIGASQREDNLELLDKRIKELNMNMKDYWWYLELRKYGSAPHSGFGLGLERALMYITGMTNIRDVALFPRTKGNLAF